VKNLLVLAVGVAAGFVAAHVVARTPEGKRFLDDVDARAREFGAAVAEGYKAREAELRASFAEAEDVISDIKRR